MYCDIPDFGRCCFCLPLRRGVLIFGYLNVLFSAFMVGVYSYLVHTDNDEVMLMYRGVTSESLPGVCIAIFCVDVIANCVLVFGTHQKMVRCIKVYYYFAITTTLAVLVLEMVEFGRIRYPGQVFEMIILTFTGLCIELYLILLVRSLLKKLEISSDNSYDNQLHMIVNGETKIENGIYNNSTVAPNN